MCVRALEMCVSVHVCALEMCVCKCASEMFEYACALEMCVSVYVSPLEMCVSVCVCVCVL